MRDSSATPERIAAQLLAAPPAGEEWAAEVLDRAAKIAAASGATDGAVTYLTRMLLEPIPDERRPGALLELGMAEAGTGGPDAVDHLLSAYRLLEVPELRVVAAYALSRVLLFVGQAQRSADFAAGRGRARRTAPGPRLDRRIGRADLDLLRSPGSRCGGALPGVEGVARGSDAGPERSRRRSLVRLALPGRQRGGIADLASTAIERAQQLEIDTGLTWIVANVVLVAAERPEALDLWDRALGRSHEQGSMFGVLSVHLWRGFTELHHGDLEDAEESLRAGIEQISSLGGSTLHYAYGLLASTLLARGRIEEAEAALASIERPDGVGDGALLWKVAEIELMLARGRNEEALAAAETHIELCDWRDNPAFAPGRRLKARALVALGRAGEAEQVLREDLELAENWGSPGTVGRALAQLGTMRGEDGIDELKRGVELLEASPLKLDLARALTALGSLLRRQRHQTDAREPLRRALELAESCGAGALTTEIRTELHATGARPRSSALSGPGFADRLRASGGRPGRRWRHQQGDRPGPVRHPQDRRGSPFQRVPQTRHQRETRARIGSGMMAAVNVRLRKLVLAVAVGAAVVSFAGCSGEVSLGDKTIDSADLESQLADQLSAQAGVKASQVSVDCPERPEGREGRRVHLQPEDAPNGDDVTVNVTLTDDSGNYDATVPKK